MSRLQKKYQEEVVPQLKKEFGIKHNLAVPKLVKIVINIGIGSIKEDQPAIEQISRDLAALSGQKPVVTRAKRAISAFKLSKGQPVGLTVTLRGKRMYDFLDKLESIVLPKVRDFRGLPATSFDDQGNYTLGLKEQAIFPEVSFHGPQSDKIRGLEITIVTTAKNKEEGKKLLELLGMPFKKN